MGIDSNRSIIDFYRKIIDISRSHNFCFFIDFDRLISEVDINHRLISITID